MEDERKYGTCPVCGERRMLESVLGSYKGQPCAAWMCDRCYVEIRDKQRKEKEHDPHHYHC